MNTVVKKSMIISLVCVLAWSSAINGRLAQPVEFNHNKHVIDVGMDCIDCHQYVETHQKASLPNREVCYDCHSEAQGESAEELKLVSLLETEQELEWQRVYVLPKHVYFSHFRHVTLGQINCSECHGDMKELTSPPVKQDVDVVNMDNCMDCHEEKQVNNDCLTCHK